MLEFVGVLIEDSFPRVLLLNLVASLVIHLVAVQVDQEVVGDWVVLVVAYDFADVVVDFQSQIYLLLAAFVLQDQVVVVLKLHEIHDLLCVAVSLLIHPLHLLLDIDVVRHPPDFSIEYF